MTQRSRATRRRGHWRTSSRPGWSCRRSSDRSWPELRRSPRPPTASAPGPSDAVSCAIRRTTPRAISAMPASVSAASRVRSPSRLPTRTPTCVRTKACRPIATAIGTIGSSRSPALKPIAKPSRLMLSRQAPAHSTVPSASWTSSCSPSFRRDGPEACRRRVRRSQSGGNVVRDASDCIAQGNTKRHADERHRRLEAREQ